MIFFPDISEYQDGLRLEGAQLVVARSSIGDRRDNAFSGFKAMADALGVPIVAYHFLWSSGSVSIADQANLALAAAQGCPLMLDVEPDGSPPQPTVQDSIDFVKAFRALGGICNTIYLPHWYWQQMGSPSLQGLVDLGLHLVSSNYSGQGGWDSYGGGTPTIWQYTDAQSFNGKNVDFNEFDGSLDELKAVFGLSGHSTPVTPPVPSPGDSVSVPFAIISVRPDVTMDTHGAKMKHVYELLLAINGRQDIASRVYVTDAFRPGDKTDYHGAGGAGNPLPADTGGLDLSGDPGPQRDLDLRDVAKMMLDYSHDFLEYIHSTPFPDDNGFYIKNGAVVDASFYGEPNFGPNGHGNHNHSANHESILDGMIADLQARWDAMNPPPPPVVVPPVVEPPIPAPVPVPDPGPTPAPTPAPENPPTTVPGPSNDDANLLVTLIKQLIRLIKKIFGS